MDRTGSLRAAASSANGKFERALADMKRYAAFLRGIHNKRQAQNAQGGVEEPT